MKVTQAQIEAALQEYARVITEIIDKKGCLGIDDRRPAMTAALTAAAAQVGERDKFYDNFHGDAAERAAQVGEKTKTQAAYEAGLEDGRAAAQVGEPNWHHGDKLLKMFDREAEADTIERCAQVAERKEIWGQNGDIVAAAIRKLKDNDKDWAHAASMAVNKTPDAFVDALRGKQERIATIERCAQVAENWPYETSGKPFVIQRAIAAAIRKLNDET